MQVISAGLANTARLSGSRLQRLQTAGDPKSLGKVRDAWQLQAADFVLTYKVRFVVKTGSGCQADGKPYLKEGIAHWHDRKMESIGAEGTNITWQAQPDGFTGGKKEFSS